MKPLSILLVDDEKAFLDSLEHYLRKQNFDVVKALKGNDALELLKEKRFDLMLLDLGLPDIDGIHVLQQVRMENKDILKMNKNLQVIILTAHGSTKTTLEAMQLNVYDYLSKPFELKELDKKIKKLFKN
ncbi:MAG: response regulator [Candidatus Gygaella obscura]|nr:response regulator [Candidatus Gygaella obscura]